MSCNQQENVLTGKITSRAEKWDEDDLSVKDDIYNRGTSITIVNFLPDYYDDGLRPSSQSDDKFLPGIIPSDEALNICTRIRELTNM